MNFISHRKPFTILILVSMLLLMVSTFELSIQAASNLKTAVIDQALYTQFSLFYEKGNHFATNYRIGTLLPVNTKVKFVTSDDTRIVIKLPNGHNLTIINIKSYSGEDIDGIFTRTLSTRPVDLSPFTDNEQKAIMAGEVKPDMSKDAVIIALGYPPKHKTPSLDLNQWRYWHNRFGTFIVHFENGKVVQIQY